MLIRSIMDLVDFLINTNTVSGATRVIHPLPRTILMSNDMPMYEKEVKKSVKERN
jgi:hypothetical protein